MLLSIHASLRRMDAYRWVKGRGGIASAGTFDNAEWL